MSIEIKCPKCGGAMREGELFINVTSNPPTIQSTLNFPTDTTLGISPVITGEGPFWHERTGERKGWLVKRDKIQTLKILGLRCIGCGYIELYAKER